MLAINNLTKTPVDKNFLTGVAKIALKGENKTSRLAPCNCSAIKKGKLELSIALVSPAEIKKLNKRYRRKNQPTDVLSFSYVSGFKFQVSSSELGEIVICPNQVKRNAKKYKTSFKKELAKVLIHGILHLLEYDHEKSKKDAEIMKKKEEYYLSKFYNF